MPINDVQAGVQQGYLTQAEFNANPTHVLLKGQAAHLEQTSTYKLGDGVTVLSALNFLGGTSALTEFFIGFGDSNNKLTGSANFYIASNSGNNQYASFGGAVIGRAGSINFIQATQPELGLYTPNSESFIELHDSTMGADATTIAIYGSTVRKRANSTGFHGYNLIDGSFGAQGFFQSSSATSIVKLGGETSYNLDIYSNNVLKVSNKAGGETYFYSDAVANSYSVRLDQVGLRISPVSMLGTANLYPFSIYGTDGSLKMNYNNDFLRLYTYGGQIIMGYAGGTNFLQGTGVDFLIVSSNSTSTTNFKTNGAVYTDGAWRFTQMSGSTNRMVQTDSDGDLSATSEIIDDEITSSTIITQITTGGNWTGVNYTGSAITGLYKGQSYTNASYYYLAIADNTIIRMARA